MSTLDDLYLDDNQADPLDRLFADLAAARKARHRDIADRVVIALIILSAVALTLAVFFAFGILIQGAI